MTPPRRPPLIQAARSGSRLALLKAAIDYAAQALSDPDCPAYVKSGLLGKVQSLPKEIAELEELAAQAEREAGATVAPDEPWDPSLI